jgi:rhodanese-related sulfurtransferase
VSFFVENWPLILLAVMSGTMLFLPQLRGARSIPVPEAVRLINREKAVLIDVCEPAEFAAGHAAGARNIPLGSLASSSDLPSNKTAPLVLMCASGMRASRAAGILRKKGYESVYPLGGGNNAWREASMPMEKDSDKEKSKDKKSR